MEKPRKILVLFSGGLDSTTCLAEAIALVGNENVIALNTRYGQKHDKEIECARKLAQYYDVRLIELDLSQIMQYSNCSLLKQSTEAVPHEEYSEQVKKTGGLPVSTYVPFRNGLFLSAAASGALSLDADTIYCGVHMDDAAGSAYPDCSVDFIRAMDEAIREGTEGLVRIDAPFVNSNKAGIVKRGLELKVPYEMTWSCYEGAEKPCMECGTCIDRIKAFEANGTIDPLLRRDYDA